MEHKVKYREIVDKTGQYYSAQSAEAVFKEMRGDIETLDLHRFYKDGTSVFSSEDIKMNKKTGLSVKQGYCSDVNPYSGISLWSPHAIIAKYLTKDTKCKIIASIPDGFELVLDRNYVATDLNGKEHVFSHYLISTKDAFPLQTVKDKCLEIETEDCDFRAATEIQSIPDFYNLFDDSVGEGFAMQQILRKCAENPFEPIDSRVSACILSVWIGANDYSDGEFLLKNYPWAFHFIYKCFINYPSTEFFYWNEHFWNAQTTMKHVKYHYYQVIQVGSYKECFRNRTCLEYAAKVPESVYMRDLRCYIGKQPFCMEQVQKGSMVYLFSYPNKVYGKAIEAPSEDLISVNFTGIIPTLVISCHECFEEMFTMQYVISKCQKHIEKDEYEEFWTSEEMKEQCIEIMKHIIEFSNIQWSEISTIYMNVYENGVCQISTAS